MGVILFRILAFTPFADNAVIYDISILLTETRERPEINPGCVIETGYSLQMSDVSGHDAAGFL
ncbi:MAG: hypothetical protein NC453_23105 [Muribaculum sp.]|nr:hypothetical protein [Muribaculum sp.]